MRTAQEMSYYGLVCGISRWQDDSIAAVPSREGIMHVLLRVLFVCVPSTLPRTLYGASTCTVLWLACTAEHCAPSTVHKPR